MFTQKTHWNTLKRKQKNQRILIPMLVLLFLSTSLEINFLGATNEIKDTILFSAKFDGFNTKAKDKILFLKQPQQI